MGEVKHRCAARGCTVQIQADRLCCIRHWKLVPRAIQKDIWRLYVPGQEKRMDPTPEYLKVMEQAIEAVWKIEQEARAKREAYEVKRP